MQTLNGFHRNPESIAVHLKSRYVQYHYALSTLNEEIINMPVIIDYKTPDNLPGSSLYEVSLGVNFLFTEQLSVSVFGISGFF